MQKYILLFILTVSLFSHCNKKEYCNCKRFESNKYNKIYDSFNGVIKNDLEIYDRIKIIDKKRDDLIKYAEKINEYIINKQIKELLLNISTYDFRRYSYREGSKTSDNISESIRKQFENKDGYAYYFFFDRLKQYENGKKPDSQSIAGLDLRTYLICFKDKLIWEVNFYQKDNRYEVWFSIPDAIIEEFAYFHYVIKEENGKYMLVGF